ncbi:ATP-dependent DNA helicase UvrD/PcrA [Lachnospiraceae bacterium TWA4]|nr:ATP-dependent DNA helicase UvrD/PcrA [Lachnospiraceae bacterium TWA4]
MTIYDTLNPMQREAVFTTEGPVLVLAGAGSGKTRALTHRIAYLIEEKGINPWNILAITFTNKAAGEMRERVDSLVEFGAEQIWVSTFHSSCVRILRRHIECLGFTSNFSIYDTDDQKTLLKHIFKKLDINTKLYKERAVLSYISNAKNQMISPDEFYKQAAGDYRQMKIGEIYSEYQKQLRENNALDFDDLLVKTVELFQKNKEVLEHYQNRFRYIMVDEYQDTNRIQFELVRLLADKYRNLCVVGDDDQSIYKFRGADIQNILGFEDTYPDAKVIKLEQNYRSTQNILNAANGVIAHNTGRKYKKLWTENEEGDLVSLKTYDTASDEAKAVVKEILHLVEEGHPYSSCAILYRTNAQSRLLEERLVNQNIPYQLVGGVNFYQRKEIKDILAYLKTIDNARDNIACQRIINVPKRGIGATSIGKVVAFADEQELTFFEALCEADVIPSLGKAAGKIHDFVNQIYLYRTKLEHFSISQLIEDILDSTGYRKELELEDTVEAQTRLENLQEFVNKAIDYESHAEGEVTLSQFLEEVALVADIDNLSENEDRVVLMTLHSSKGLEFDHVFLCGMEEGLFPSYLSMNSEDPNDLEEERRLAYVGFTRAKKKLYLTSARSRMVNGETRFSKVSSFCDEIPPLYLNKTAKKESVASLPKPSVGYSRPKYDFNNFTQKSIGKAFTVEKAKSLDYQVGDKVKHKKFGVGVVLEIADGPRDYEVKVEFERVGVKKDVCIIC